MLKVMFFSFAYVTDKGKELINKINMITIEKHFFILNYISLYDFISNYFN
ncbi:hypothetical protein BCE_0169 [Bacillus cereus ATCC 10987]|uniref:Uncharacterized protein n=1 Tax=Bacillus cereus (strain ATCC 10987 / NRS 248) TaxID=222523 RepID=Q73F38_BACC1|nr:hypothetical protein BCE_0169 [Bacillus cereus ATCC 10987]